MTAKTSIYKKRINEIHHDLALLRALVQSDPLKMREHPASRVIKHLEDELAEIWLLCDVEGKDEDER